MAKASFQGIRRAALAFLLGVFGTGIAHAADDMTCPEYTHPENWRLPLLLIDNGAKDGPPEMAQAAAALHAGRREEGVALLAKAGSVSTTDLLRPPINRPFINAVLIARENAWLLDGCR